MPTHRVSMLKGFWVALGMLLVGWLAASLSWPMGYDQGIHAWVGDIIVSGGLPYKDAWDVKGPLTHYIYVFLQNLFGRTEWGIRLFDLTLLLAAAVSLWHLIRNLGYPKAAPIASLLYCFWYGGTGYCHTAQPDGWAGMLSIFMMDLLIGDRGLFRLKTAILCGGLLALSVLLKLPFFLLFLAVFGYVAAYPPGKKGNRLIFLVSVTMSLFLLLFMVILWFEKYDALKELIDIQFLFNRNFQKNHHGHYGLVWMATKVVRFFMKPEMVVGVGFAVIGLFHLWFRERRTAILTTGWFLAAFSGVIVQNQFFNYHWNLVLPPLSLWAALGLLVSGEAAANLGSSTSSFPPRREFARIFFSIMVVLLFLSSGLHSIFHSYRYVRSVLGIKSWSSYYDGFGQKEGSDYWYPAIRDVSRYLKEKTSEKDRVLVWGYQPIIYFLSGRKSPDRFGSLYPLVVRFVDEKIKERYRREFVRSIIKTPPQYIVFFESDTKNLNGKMAKAYLDLFPDLRNLIKDHYTPDRLIGNLSVSHLRTEKD